MVSQWIKNKNNFDLFWRRNEETDFCVRLSPGSDKTK